ncbi:unnamed protein product, partial [Brenthis ino]
MINEAENKEEAENKNLNVRPSPSSPIYKRRKSVRLSTGTFRLLRFDSFLPTWTEVSKINYLSSLSLEDLPEEQHFRSISLLPRFVSFTNDNNMMENKHKDSIVSKQFSANVTHLLNEEQLWGCFYNFPELYDDVYSPVVRIRNIEDVPEIKEGVLTRDMVTACLSYLKRTPILGDYVYIKLNLSSKRLASLNHMRLLWLNVSYNNISSYEFGPDVGLWTLLHLEYLNLNENNLTSMKIFAGCTRLRELHARNNSFSTLLELAVYMRNMRRLNLLDLRSNPVCTITGYKDVVFNIFPLLIHLDAKEVDPVEQRTSKMCMTPDVSTFATHRLLRLLYIQQLSRSRVSPYTPPADTTDIPIVVIVGYEAVGKGTLSRRLALECSNIELALQHTTAFHHLPGHYKVISRKQFDDMLLNGDLLTYSEMNGESYGLSREEAFVKDGKVKIVTTDLIGALMLKLRGYRPYLILASCLDKRGLAHRQQERKEARNIAYQKKQSMNMPMEISTLQVLLSGRIIINGILNEIIQSSVSLVTNKESDKYSGVDSSLFSLYKEPPNMDEYVSDVYGLTSNQDKGQYKRPTHFQTVQNKQDINTPKQKSIDFKYTSSTWKGFAGSRKSSKSVTFTSPENTSEDQNTKTIDPSGLMIDPQPDKAMENLLMKSISTKVPWPHADGIKPQDSDLWLAFLLENGLVQTTDTNVQNLDRLNRDTKVDDQHFIVTQLERYEEVSMDNHNVAFKKLKNIIKDIVASQKKLKPMFDIDFANMKHPLVERKLASICRQIAPQRLFY